MHDAVAILSRRGGGCLVAIEARLGFGDLCVALDVVLVYTSDARDAFDRG